MIKQGEKGAIDIKLIDYEGIVPEGSNNLITTTNLPYDIYFLTDKDLRTAYYDYIKFIFISDVLGRNGNDDIGKMYRNLYKLSIAD